MDMPSAARGFEGTGGDECGCGIGFAEFSGGGERGGRSARGDTATDQVPVEMVEDDINLRTIPQWTRPESG